MGYCLNVYLCLKLEEDTGSAFNLFSPTRCLTREEPETVILEAFSRYLQAADPSIPATKVLARWLWERLSIPAQNNVDRILRSEISIEWQKGQQYCKEPEFEKPASQTEPFADPKVAFVTSTESGRRLLKSLYEYAMSYEQQKWSRWVHCVKASDFNDLSG